jgi:UDP-N-acetyl-D-mannosaminuronate dehydrogenase
LGTLGFALSYAEAKKLANDVGVDITESEYDEARKAEKQEQYANDLQDFFAGKKDGGRIGFQNGSIRCR